MKSLNTISQLFGLQITGFIFVSSSVTTKFIIFNLKFNRRLYLLNKLFIPCYHVNS